MSHARRCRDVCGAEQHSGWLRRCAGAAVACAALLAVACGGSTTTPAGSTATTPAAPHTVTAAQSIAVAKALFPLSSTMGGYSECDIGLDNISPCPFDVRLHSQVAIYAANWQRLYPQGAGGAAALLLRGQCAIFANENITTAQNPAVAIVRLTGQQCGGPDQTMYVSVVVESGQPLADDVECNAADPQHGMYNSDSNAVGGDACAPASS